MFYRLKNKNEALLQELQKIMDKDPKIIDGLPLLYREAALRILQEKRDTEQGER
jgi:hypothetical protein